MTSEDFKNVTEGLKNVVLLLAVLVGGFWTLYVFDSKLEVENAKAQLKKLEIELDRVPIVTAEIDATYLTTPDSYIVRGTLTMKNNGTESAVIELSGTPITMAKPVFKSNVIQSYDSVIGLNSSSPYCCTINRREVGHVTLLPGHEKTILFFVMVKEPGLYQIMYRGEPSDSILALRPNKSDNPEFVTAYGSIYIPPREPNKSINMDAINSAGS